MALSADDAAFLEAARARLSDEDWRAVLIFAQVLSDRIFPDEIRGHLTGMFEAMVRYGARIAFADDAVKEAYQRAISHPDAIAVTLMFKEPGSMTVQGVRAETKYHDGRDRRRPRAS